MAGVKQDVFFFWFACCAIVLPAAAGRTFPLGAFYAAFLVLGVSIFSLWRRDALFDVLLHLQRALEKKFFWPFFGLIALLWAGVFSLKYFSLGYHTFDTGIYAQMLAYFAEHGVYFSTFSRKHALSDHFTPNLLLLAPLFRWHPAFGWLIVFKAAAFLACPLLLLSFGRRFLGSASKLAYLCPIMMLVHPFLAQLVFFEFQPSTLAMPFILLSFFYAAADRLLLAAAVLVFAAGFKENLPLIWVAVGCYLMLEKRRFITGAAFIAGGAAAGYVLNYCVIPYFNQGAPSPHSELLEPRSHLLEKGQLIVLAFSSVGFLPLLAPRIALAVLPAFGTALLSRVPVMFTFGYQYQDLPLAALFAASLLALGKYHEGRSWLNAVRTKYRELFICVGIAGAIFCFRGSVAVFLCESWPTKRELKLHREVAAYAVAAPKDKDIWAVERLSVFFVGHPRLRSLDRYRALAPYSVQPKSNPPHIMVLPDAKELSSLDKEFYQELRRRLEGGVREGRYRLQPGYEELLVYEYTGS
ncbi:MAG TPA: DUF2079 domain-containing protein [Oligoflexia bacterium]|nr:DUF2079 domain-containing protein [Oligoflexia bacterium]